MAEFKLGRIRFVWQGDWAAQTAYVADDVVSFGGKSYICIKITQLQQNLILTIQMQFQSGTSYQMVLAGKQTGLRV